MSGFYSEVAMAVRETLIEFGASAVLKQRTSTHNPATGIAAISTVTIACVCAVFDYKREFVDQSSVLEGDKQVFMSVVAGGEPKAGDRLAISGVDHNVVAVKKLAPAGIAVLYELQVRL